MRRFFRRRHGESPTANWPVLGVERAACYVFAIKKSGTHLVRNVLQQLGQRCLDCLAHGTVARVAPRGGPIQSFVLSLERPSLDWRASCQRGEARIIFNLRDPRAIFLSLIDFYDWNVPLGSPGLHTVEFRRAACRGMFRDRDELALALIEDETLDDDPYTPWLNFRRSRSLYHHPAVLKVRFEDIATAARGGTATADHPVTRICSHLGIAEPADPGAVVRRAVSAESRTKNVGDPDRWRTALSPRLLAAFMARHGDLVRDFGYPEH